MRATTIRGQLRAERIMERREQFFDGIDRMTDEQIARCSEKWHALANRYMRLVAHITLRTLESQVN